MDSLVLTLFWMMLAVVVFYGVAGVVWMILALCDLLFGGSAEDEWCEGCGDRATQHDLDGVPLCDDCAKPDDQGGEH